MNGSSPLIRIRCALILGLMLTMGLSDIGLPSPTTTHELHAPTVFVKVSASTFKTRGRIFYDVEGSILKKIQSAGLHTTRDSDLPFDYVLEVQYEEQRGEEFDIGRWGTIIEGEFVYRKKHGEVLWNWQVREVSTNDISGAPPYIDALLKFATHPNYFFLGPILKEVTLPEASISRTLTQALLQRLREAYPLPREQDPEAAVYQQDHFMDAIHVVHQDVAFQRTFDDLLDQKVGKEALVAIAERFLHSSDPQLRVRGVRVLGDAASHQNALRQLAMNDPNREVREAAKNFLSLTSTLP